MERILDIVDAIAHEKGLMPTEVKDALKTAMIKAAQATIGENLTYEVEFDEAKRKAKIFQKVTVVSDSDDRGYEDNKNFLFMEEATEIDPEVEIGDELRYEIDLTSYGRGAAMSLQRELDYQIQRLVENQLFNKYKQKVGSVIIGVVARIDSDETTYIEIQEIRAVLPMKNRIKGEKFKVGDTVKGVLRGVFIDKSKGIIIEMSRTAPKFLEELLKLEVPEINDQLVTVHAISRIPGERAKIAISSNSPRIDPVGATVGVRGVRINAISKELSGENIDVIEYSAIPELFVSRAMSPALVEHVVIKGSDAIVTITPDQKAKAIGKSGINIRLASMLTGLTINLQEKEGHYTSSDNQSTEESSSDEPTSNPLEALFK